MADRVDRTERLLNLVICLMASSQPVPRAEIHRQIPGYAQTASEAAFERMFERDKDELRSMGIPVETVADSSGEVLGYRIPRDQYAMPGIDLTLEERAAVAVAAQVWGQAVAAPVAGTALRKLESHAGDPHTWSPADLHGTIELTTTDAALLPLMAALRQDRMVTFAYQTPTDSAPRTRTVSPWGLRSGGGHWFLVGHDHDRGEPRTYRLSRVRGAVTVTGRAREQAPPQDFDIASFGTAESDERVRARVRVSPGRAASLRRRAVSDDAWTADEIVVEGASVEALASQICATGPDVVVLEPDDVIHAVRAGLAAVAAAHRSEESQ
jgi:proteasome accessory factor B